MKKKIVLPCFVFSMLFVLGACSDSGGSKPGSSIFEGTWEGQSTGNVVVFETSGAYTVEPFSYELDNTQDTLTLTDLVNTSWVLVYYRDPDSNGSSIYDQWLEQGDPDLVFTLENNGTYSEDYYGSMTFGTYEMNASTITFSMPFDYLYNETHITYIDEIYKEYELDGDVFFMDEIIYSRTSGNSGELIGTYSADLGGNESSVVEITATRLTRTNYFQGDIDAMDSGVYALKLGRIAWKIETFLAYDFAQDGNSFTVTDSSGGTGTYIRH